MEVPAAEREAAAAAALAATSAATPGGQGPPGLPLDVRARIAAAQELANRMSSQSTVRLNPPSSIRCAQILQMDLPSLSLLFIAVHLFCFELARCF